jgi:Ca2+-transporting ATPase
MNEPTPTRVAEEGLEPAEAARRLAAEGPNAVTTSKAKQLPKLILELVTEPMIGLLLVLVVIYLVLGELREAIAMGVSVLGIITLTLFQEWRTERAVEALKDLASPKAVVIRGGKATRIESAELVRGDRILLEEGDRIPADGVLIPSKKDAPEESLHIDESLLTGESVAVIKTQDELVFSSTLVVGGRAHVEVTAIGANTRIGKLGTALGKLAPEVSPLRKQVDRLVKIFGAMGLTACALFSIGLWLRGDGLVPSLLSGIGLAIGMIPEEYPVVLTVFLAMGAWRMAKEHVLVRRLPAIEALGSATVLSCDKTGTLTENQMRITALWTANAGVETLEGEGSVEAQHILRAGALASRRETAEPMDAAFWRTMKALREESQSWELVHDHPFGQDAVTGRREISAARAFRVPGTSTTTVSLKGAPEAVLELCRVDEALHAKVLEGIRALAAQGLRVLAVGEATHEGETPEDRREIAFQFLGLVGIEDPVRADVPEAMRAIQRAGIRILIITGDDPETARAVAIKAGLDAPEVIRGDALDALDDKQLQAKLPSIQVIARAQPEQKLRVVQALAARGDVVAMTGDGVNDSLALKASAIGIAMGGRGTDVAREAASIVLTDDRFASIVSGLSRGRRIFENLRRASAFILVVHIVVAGLVLIPAAFGLPAALLPLHIVALELLIDPACSVVFESEPMPLGLMERPPRALNASVLNRFGVISSVAVGVLSLGAGIGVFMYGIAQNVPETAARFCVFAGIVTAILTSILASRVGQIKSHNRAYIIAASASALALAIGLFVPPLREALHWAIPPVGLLAMSIGLSMGAVVLGQMLSHAFVRTA